MRSYQVRAFGAPLAEAVLDDPTPRGTEVLLRVRACGVCHSDVHLRAGYFDLGEGRRADLTKSVDPPRTLGHEVVGEVIATGTEASGIEVGEIRAVFPWIGCGECVTCRAGAEHLCAAPRALGVNRDGGYSDRLLVPHPRYLVDHSGVADEVACTYACSGLTAYSALKKAGRLDTGPLVVVGSGGVGLAALRLAKTVAGVEPVVADIDPEKRKAALGAGAREAIDPAEEGAARRFLKETGGARAVLDFVGSASTARFGTDVLGKGGRLVVVGLYGGTFTLPVPYFPLKAIAVEGSYAGRLDEMREVVELARSGALAPIPIATRPLAEANATLDDLEAGRIVGRAVLTP